MRRTVLVVVLLGQLTGCWYGPPEETARIEHALRRWNSHSVAVAVVHTRQRPPRGLNTFPNGGVPRVLDASVDLYFGDPARAWLRHAGHFPAPSHLLHGLGAHVEGLAEGAAYLVISGCAQNECWGDLRNFERHRVSTDGTVQEVDSVPEAARARGESLARMQGEHRYLRIGHGSTTVEASLDPGQDREVVFRLDAGDGTLRLEEPYPFAVPATPGMEPPRAPGEALLTRSESRSVTGAECLNYPWRHPPAWPAEQLLSSRCEVVDTGSLPGTETLDWTWALYHRESVYEAPPDVLDHDLELYPDTVREAELILLFGGAGETVARPVWHDRAEETYEFLRLPRAAPLADGTVFMIHRRCLNGTGGCADYPYRLTVAGRVEPLQPAYAEQLKRLLPTGSGMAKGIQIEPDGPTLYAAVYLPADANCCPSFFATGLLRVAGDSLVADSIVIEPATSPRDRGRPNGALGP
jgi:hypothetical protein